MSFCKVNFCNKNGHLSIEHNNEYFTFTRIRLAEHGHGHCNIKNNTFFVFFFFYIENNTFCVQFIQ